MSIASINLPDLALRAALGDRGELLGSPIALAPQHDSKQAIGQVSEPARRLGVGAGMGLGEAMDICPSLKMVAPDPGRAEEIWEAVLARLEGLGAAVESDSDGEAFFDTIGLEPMYGGTAGVLGKVRAGLGPNLYIGAAPTRLAAHAIARRAPGPEGPDRHEGRKPPILAEAELDSFLSRLPIEALTGRLGAEPYRVAALISSLRRLGIKDLGALGRLPTEAVADRFGPLGLVALRVSRGVEPELRPRAPAEEIREALDLPESNSGGQLGGALTIVTDRLAARLARESRCLRRVELDAKLSGGGSWRCEAVPRRPTARPEMLRMLLAPKLDRLPRPAHRLEVRATGLTAGSDGQMEISRSPGRSRRKRLSEAARQVRAAVGDAGRGGLLRVLDAEAGSHLPERRMMLTPYLPDHPSTGTGD